MITRLTALASCVFVVGYVLAAILFRSNGKKIRRDPLETKILMWIPLFLICLLFVTSDDVLRSFIVLWVLWHAFGEILRQKQAKTIMLRTSYLLLISGGVICAVLLVHMDRSIFLAVWLASVMSDVTAFFLGNYRGKHRLPRQLNSRKSWEGVGGQFIGAWAGVLLLNQFVTPIPAYLAITVGCGSAAGDLLNSYVKRRLDIHDWGNSIPGHGGYLDRFSSLSLALLLSYVGLRTI